MFLSEGKETAFSSPHCMKDDNTRNCLQTNSISSLRKKKKGYSYTFVYFNILCQPKERAHAQTVEAKHFQQFVDFIFVYMFLSSVTGEKTETLEEKSPTDALLCS